MNKAPFFEAAMLAEAPGLRHGFFGRRGGVSEGPFASLNCSTANGDDPARVAENRRRVCAALDLMPESLVTVTQVHGIQTAVITGIPEDASPADAGIKQPEPREADASPADAGIKNPERREADALVTAMPGVALGLLTADCAPVLLVDPKARVIGAAHAGWRGALGGVLHSVVGAMENLGAKPGDILAAIGPTIGPGSYQVGPEFSDPFLNQDPGNQALFSDASGHMRFDLPGFIAARLLDQGVRALDLGHDTYAEENKFFSYRKATKSAKPGTPAETGRQLSVICLG